MSGTDESLRWYALRVLSQREQMVMKILRYDGLRAHIKTETRLRRRSKKDKMRLKIEYCAAPGYVFVGLPANDDDPWRLVRKLHLIRSVVSKEGRPAVLNIPKLIAFLDFDDFSVPDYFKYFKTNEEPDFGIGDTVRVVSGPFQGFQLPVQEIRPGEAIFHLVMFDKTVEVPVPVADCVKAKAA